MSRNIMIFSDDLEKAFKKLDQIASSLDEEILIRTKDYLKTTKRTIQARKFSDCRGYRYMDVYVDDSLPNYCEAMGWILMKLVPPNYNVNFEHEENYDWRNHVFYF